MRHKWQWTLLIGLVVTGLALVTVPTWGQEESQWTPPRLQRFESLMGDMSTMVEVWKKGLQDPQARQQMGPQMMQMARMMNQMGQMMGGTGGPRWMGSLAEPEEGAYLRNPCWAAMGEEAELEGMPMMGRGWGGMGRMGSMMGEPGQVPEEYRKLRAEHLRLMSKWMAQQAEELEKAAPQPGTEQEQQLEQMEQQMKELTE